MKKVTIYVAHLAMKYGEQFYRDNFSLLTFALIQIFDISSMIIFWIANEFARTI